ncbi:MAG TPA: hypothetical protein VMA13_09190 [Candidatus Saccharimonadales bacterium]|nr:hypothetical protein [Candidatus Saccharimonadales bacterium]
MKIFFKIDQADLFRRGIDSDDSIVELNVNPATLPADQHDLLSRHLLPSDGGCEVVHDRERALQGETEVVPVGGKPGATMVVAESPALESVLAALRELEMQTGPMDEIAFKPLTVFNDRRILRL